MAALPLDDERLSALALWSTPGVGRRTIEQLRKSHGCLAGLLRIPVREWGPRSSISALAQRGLSRWTTLLSVAEEVLEQSKGAGMQLAFVGDMAYPEGLQGIQSAPPVLFYFGTWRMPRRRIAMVGTRFTSQSVLAGARRLAQEVASAGVCVVSGAALGVDQACHDGALSAGGETWAFMGSALDQLDPSQAALVPAFREGQGLLYSEFPPGVRADRFTFPRRNRLISGASHGVLVIRAGARSGALHTARYALAQGRPVLAFPGELNAPDAAGNLLLLQKRQADLCFGLEDVLRCVGLEGGAARNVSGPGEKTFRDLSEPAHSVYEALKSCALDLEELLSQTKLDSSQLSTALCELELAGVIIQRPGKRFERI